MFPSLFNITVSRNILPAGMDLKAFLSLSALLMQQPQCQMKVCTDDHLIMHHLDEILFLVKLLLDLSVGNML